MSKYQGFNTVEFKRPERSLFDMSHEKKMTLQMGKIVPCFIAESLPGDSWRINAQVRMRLLALLAPIYGLLQVTMHFFCVPHRLLWSEWDVFITAGRLGDAVGGAAPIPPFYTILNMQTVADNLIDHGSLADYLGVPQISDGAAGYTTQAIDAMPFLAYQLVWYEYYRDRNFTPDTVMTFPSPSGSLATFQMLDLQTRHYSPDYFTTALPFTQRGTEVLLPLEGTGSVTYLPTSLLKRSDGAAPSLPNVYFGAEDDTTTGRLYDDASAFLGGFGARVENIDEVTLNASSVTINDFRAALALQSWFERNAVAGSRYTESIYAHFGVKPQDYRLQRPEYIGGAKLPIQISEVVNTAFSENEALEVIPAGNLAGHGLGRGNAMVSYYSQEHCFIIGLMTITTPPSYMKGLPRMFRRRTFLDYVFPTFARLGEQPVYNYELFVDPANLTPDPDTDEFPVFGYQSRYADWKWLPSTTHGDFRGDLLFWTLTRDFTSTPTLGNLFLQVEGDAFQQRIFAVNGNNFLAYMYNSVTVKRCLPYFSTPRITG